MYLVDYHTHSLCSFDGSEPLVSLARAAQAAGMSQLCLTDHCDLVSPEGKLQLTFQWPAVEEQLALAHSALGSALPIRMGVELGEPWEAPDFAAQVVSHPELDFVLGSVHNLSLADGGTDFYYVNFKTEDDCHYVLSRYFNCMETLCAMDHYDVLAHIIYPLRYMNRRDGNHVTLERYLPQLERILRAVISSDRGIELNTCRGETVEDWRQVLGLYRDCGGRIVTLGSDAHAAADVGKGIARGAALLKEYGFDLAVYERRQPQLLRL